MRLRVTMLGRDFARRWGKARHRTGAGGPPRARVLVEIPDTSEAFAYWRVLEDNGFAATWCPGP
ncbi:MAG: hypothetical protein ABSG81_02980, partial [Acidimicrobiales bacterium]